MNNYRWSCYSCGQGNDPAAQRCSKCGFPSHAKGSDIVTRTPPRSVPAHPRKAADISLGTTDFLELLAHVTEMPRLHQAVAVLTLVLGGISIYFFFNAETEWLEWVAMGCAAGSYFALYTLVKEWKRSA